MLATLTPTEYAEFRDALGPASGFQSFQYRAVEFALGNKNREMLRSSATTPDAQAPLTDLLERPSVYDEFLRFLARQGHAVPPALLDRDVTAAHTFTPELVPVSAIYEHAHEHWEAYEACEELIDLEENFQLWRFRHLKTVERTIGDKRGTGGSSGDRVPARGAGPDVLPRAPSPSGPRSGPSRRALVLCTGRGTLVPIMGWFLLVIAILSEVAATLALRAAGEGSRPALLVVVVGYVVSLSLLAVVVRHLDVSIAYAVWAGAGTALVALFGVMALGEPATAIKLASIGLIIVGVVGLNLVGSH